MIAKLVSFFVGLFMLVVVLGCNREEKLVGTQSSGTFMQEFNPEYIDVLWVIDDRSTLYPVRSHLVSEAQKFFTKLEGVRKGYRMAFVSSDMQFAKGALKPAANPVILERHIGDTNSYVSFFGSIINQVIINLGTGAEPKGFEAALAALNGQFAPRKGVPLVLIFISDSEDQSTSKADGVTPVDFYSSKFIALKDGNSKLVKAYSINYTPAGQRCTGSVYDADIDRKNPDGTSAYEGKAFGLAAKLGGDTADICEAFADKLSLDGLRLKELPKRFTLEKKAKPESISVSVVLTNGDLVKIPFHYEAATNEVVFDTLPPEGSSIQVSYLPI